MVLPDSPARVVYDLFREFLAFAPAVLPDYRGKPLVEHRVEKGIGDHGRDDGALRAAQLVVYHAPHAPGAPPAPSYPPCHRLYPLAVTLKMFLTQCLSDDPSCRTAVATAKERGWLPHAASPDTGAYCRARDHLSPSGLAALVARTGGALENVRQPEQLWRV